MVELLLRKIAAAHPRPYKTIARVQRQKAGLQHGALLAWPAPSVCQRLQLRQLPGHGLVGGLLQPGIDGGAHHQPVGMDVVVALIRPGDQPFAQLLGDVGRRPGRLDLPLEIQPQRPLGQRLDLGGLELAVLGHLGQHEIAAPQCALRMQHGVVGAGALEHADERGGLQHIQPFGGFVEIGARRHLDAEGVVEKRHGVEIGLEDLALGINRLDLEGRDRFLDLAREGGARPISSG